MKKLKPHYKIVSLQDKMAMMNVHYNGMGVRDDEYNFPLAAWTMEQAITIMAQARCIMGWNVMPINGKFYHVYWR